MIRKLNKFVFLFSANCCLQSASTTSSLLPGAGAGKSAKSGLRSGAGGLGAVSSGGTKLDVQGGDAERLNFLSDILGSQHSSVRGCLVPVSLHLHAASNSGDGFTARQVGDVDESVVERGEDVSHSEHKLTFANLGTKGNLDLLLHYLSLSRSHFLSFKVFRQAV